MSTFRDELIAGEEGSTFAIISFSVRHISLRISLHYAHVVAA